LHICFYYSSGETKSVGFCTGVLDPSKLTQVWPGAILAPTEQNSYEKQSIQKFEKAIKKLFKELISDSNIIKWELVFA
jgi:hypothetical protein